MLWAGASYGKQSNNLDLSPSFRPNVRTLTLFAASIPLFMEGENAPRAIEEIDGDSGNTGGTASLDALATAPTHGNHCS